MLYDDDDKFMFICVRYIFVIDNCSVRLEYVDRTLGGKVVCVQITLSRVVNLYKCC